jgi:Carboxypeptidase regulatory-like domain
VYAQETTGGMQGAVKDATGAFIPGAEVHVASPSLVGGKLTQTDSKGNYRFTNLPPGPYVLTVKAQGFTALRREGLVIEVGHLPTVDLILTVGAETTVVDVSAESPVIDVTTTTTQTNITADVINDVPHGRSFQSVIQFAPSARNEPLMGMTPTSTGNGNGGTSPGGGSNGQGAGYSVAGGSDSENAYLVEGQETANVIGGYSHTNVPFDFIQEVQVKSSGVEAEHGGSLGGVVNVIMKKGSNNWHGSAFLLFENGAMAGSPTARSRYNPADSGTTLANGIFLDPAYQEYQSKKDKTSNVFPGLTIGGPILHDKAFLFFGFNPQFNDLERKVDFSSQGLGELPFSSNQQTYYTTARIDASVSKKIHVFASWLYQGQRESGESLPFADSTTGLSNPSASVSPIAFSHAFGYSAPNSTFNFGGDITLTPRIVSTSRFGYFFENYHDFGYPTSGTTYAWWANGQGATDTNGNPLPAGLQQIAGYFTAGNDQNFTLYNANKHIQFDQDIAVFKSGWGGTHNFKFGYQLNRASNKIFQRWNQPYVELFPGSSQSYSPAGSTGAANCAALIAANGSCTGTYGYATVQDYGSFGQAVSYNHSLFAQDAWTLGKGLTINAGLRIEKEYLPSETTADGFPATPIQFGWGDKIAPRVGAAWDVFRNGKMKAFAGYGVFNDVMKLNLAISSFGGQYWQNCAYALNTPDYTVLNQSFNTSGRYCTGDSTGGANFASGSTPTGVTFLENLNQRGTEGVTPGLKPYRQHEGNLGVDYQLTNSLAVEARWDRRRLDHVIEDAALFDSTGSEVFTIVNPGEGQNKTNTTCDGASGITPPCPNNIKPARSYDGLELRLIKSVSNHWFGLFSYTYSNFRGNYSGLTSSDLADGGGGRNAPNNSRSFDETYFQYNAYGGSSSGPLATDRPNAFKGYAYYDWAWNKRNTTDIGIFQVAYSGSPVSSYLDVGYSSASNGNGGGFPVYVEGRGKWVDVAQDPTTGAVTVGNAYSRRTPWYTQSDLNLKHTVKVKESMALGFDATITNLLNQRSVTAYNEQIDSMYVPSFVAPGGIPFYYGGQAYSLYEHPYNYKALLNTDGVSISSQYGKPYLYQLSRNIRLGAHFTF